MIDSSDQNVIDDVLARYGWAFDSGDGDAYAALFREDGVLTGFGEPIRGQAALAATVVATPAQTKGKWRHHLTNLVCDYAGDDRDRVTARGYQLVTDWNTAPGKPHMMVEARWDLVRAGEAWRIAAVDLGFVGPTA
jgi:uncharacterized protein (TIGR02246 family)